MGHYGEGAGWDCPMGEKMWSVYHVIAKSKHGVWSAEIYKTLSALGVSITRAHIFYSMKELASAGHIVTIHHDGRRNYGRWFCRIPEAK